MLYSQPLFLRVCSLSSEPLVAWVAQEFPDAALLDSHGGLFNYEISQVLYFLLLLLISLRW